MIRLRVKGYGGNCSSHDSDELLAAYIHSMVEHLQDDPTDCPGSGSLLLLSEMRFLVA